MNVDRPSLDAFIGLGVVGIGILWQKREDVISQRLRAFLPRDLRELVEWRAA